MPGAFGKFYPKQRLKYRDSFKFRTAVADTRHRVKRRPMRLLVWEMTRLRRYKAMPIEEGGDSRRIRV
jgi:hypothetical protein